MSTPDIPVLTKVHSKPNHKSQTGETSESANLANVIAQVKQALLPELQPLIQAQIQQLGPDFQVDTSSIEKQFQETQLALMTQSRKDMEQEGERLTKELTASINQDISDKITGMQELAVNQARSQISHSIASMEEGFKEAIQNHAKQQEHMLLAVFEQQAQQTKIQMAEKTNSMSAQLLDVMSAYSQKLIEEGKAKLENEQQVIQNNMLEKSKQAFDAALMEVAQSQQQHFIEQLSAKLPALEQAMSEKVRAMVVDEMQQHMKAIEAELTRKLKLNIVEVLQGIKFVFPNTNNNVSGQ